MINVPISIDVVVEVADRNNIPESIFELAEKYNVLVANPGGGDPIPLMTFIEHKKAVNA